MIQKKEWNGLQVVEFAAGGYRALLVPAMGANLISLRNETLGVDILRSPSPAEMEEFASRPQIFGLPLLFPPNRIEDGTYTYGGRTYRFPITLPAQNNFHHGTIKSQPFTVTLAEDGADYALVEATYFSNAFNDAIYSYFPHAFECRMRFRLSAEGLEHSVTFRNLSDSPMPTGVGYHTPFNVPFREGGNAADYRLRLAAGQRWELSADRTLPTGKLFDLSAEEQKLRGEGIVPVGTPTEGAYTMLPLEVDGKPYRGAILTDTAAGVSVFYEVDEKMRHWTLWNNGGGVPWVCPEPQSWAINAPNLALPAQVTGVEATPAGSEWTSACRIFCRKA